MAAAVVAGIAVESAPVRTWWQSKWKHAFLAPIRRFWDCRAREDKAERRSSFERTRTLNFKLDYALRLKA